MRLSLGLYMSIMSSYITTIPEQGGILGEKNGELAVYHHDTLAPLCSSHAEYKPDVDSLNRIIRSWSEDGIMFAGIIHSHPENEAALSESDMDYISRVFEPFNTGHTLYFPVILGEGVMLPYAITKKDDGLSVVCEDLYIYSD